MQRVSVETRLPGISGTAAILNLSAVVDLDAGEILDLEITDLTDPARPIRLEPWPKASNEFARARAILLDEASKTRRA